MDLRTWLFKNRISLRQFAKKIDYNFSYLSLIMNYKKVPSEKLAAKIEEGTNGAVKGQQLIKKCLKESLKSAKAAVAAVVVTN